jgi:hypothetical protein
MDRIVLVDKITKEALLVIDGDKIEVTEALKQRKKKAEEEALERKEEVERGSTEENGRRRGHTSKRTATRRTEGAGEG